MGSATGRLTPLWAALGSFVVVTGLVAGVLHVRGDDAADKADGRSAVTGRPLVEVQVLQTRPDEVIHGVQLAVTNLGTETLVVDRMRLTADGFTGAGWVPRDSPIPAGQRVNLPTFYGKPRCPAEGEPALGVVRVDLRLHIGSGGEQAVRVQPRASRALLNRIIGSQCLEQRLLHEVALSFGSRWRTEGRGDATRLHTTIEARLAPDAPARDITQLAGTVLYNLAVDSRAGPAAEPGPYASLDPGHPAAAIPVVVSQARCTGHAKGETKQPFRFLVWLGDPGTDGVAVQLPVSAADRGRLRAVCAF